jgi:hypothetical protein
MGPRVLLILTLLVVALTAAAAQASADAKPPRMQTKTQAEVHLLRIAARSWKASRMPGLVNPHTHMLADNSQALCQGKGKRRSGVGLYSRFVCVVRPLHHRLHQGLYVSYRVLANGRSEVHWIAYRMR